jgi:hypothetical protein
LRRIEEDIAPFKKPVRYGGFSTAGQWRETSEIADTSESRSRSRS